MSAAGDAKRRSILLDAMMTGSTWRSNVTEGRFVDSVVTGIGDFHRSAVRSDVPMHCASVADLGR